MIRHLTAMVQTSSWVHHHSLHPRRTYWFICVPNRNVKVLMCFSPPKTHVLTHPPWAVFRVQHPEWVSLLGCKVWARSRRAHRGSRSPGSLQALPSTRVAQFWFSRLLLKAQLNTQSDMEYRHLKPRAQRLPQHLYGFMYSLPRSEHRVVLSPWHLLKLPHCSLAPIPSSSASGKF